MSQRLEFIDAVLHRPGGMRIKDVCTHFSISEKCGHKWLNRFEEGGPAALADHSHAPRTPAHQVPADRIKAICALRSAHPTWGARKLHAVLQQRSPAIAWPVPSTITTILKREGLVVPRRRTQRERSQWAATNMTSPERPNHVWAADFKGQFRLGTGAYCYPLTVTDLCARYILGVTALPSVAALPVVSAFRRLFERFGLPEVIRTDNGVPFGAPSALGGLSALAVWWIRLGIRPERIHPGQPQENGSHERMHRTLKAETTRPAAASMSAQQRRFVMWQRTFNNVRPHESLRQTPPSAHYAPSPRPLPPRLPALAYPASHELRLVSSSGTISWGGSRLFLSEVLDGEYVSLHETDEGEWTVHFGSLTLGTYSKSTLSFAEALAWKPLHD